MTQIPKVITEVVNQDLCTGCGLCVYKCPSGALKMNWNEYGFLVPEIANECSDNGDCLTVCPFNPYPEEALKTEDEIAEKILWDEISRHPKIGKYKGIYAGYANEYRLTSSSGGMATYVASELLEQGFINHVISVKESEKPGQYYEYAISSTREELLTTSKTRYFPVTLGSVLTEINQLNGKIAIVGVACFVKAVRLAQLKEPYLKEKIPFLIGIICGGLKSRFFTEYLADKSGANNHFRNPQYRIKNLESSAGDYLFGCTDLGTNSKKSIRMKTVGDMWGTGLFKANACDFCEDVTTELADISMGDAWIKPYHLDGKGTNLVITRSHFADDLIQQGIQQGKLNLEKLTIDRLLFSQKGSFNHRHTGLSVRIKMAEKKGLKIPPKRFGNEKVPIDFKIVQRLRRKTRKKSLTIWRKYNDASVFDKKMAALLKLLKLTTTLYHYKKRRFKKTKNKQTAMKIGILTFHHSNYNYGAVLQAFSIYKLIESLGYESYIINYAPEPAGFKKKIAAQIVALLGLEFKKFRKNYIKRMLPKTNQFSELKKLNEMLDGFVVGSDQVWRYRKDEQSMFRYYLDFADDNKTKIAYAASFGVDHWEADEKVTQKIKKLVERFQAISVREESGVEICKTIFGMATIPVLDPTLLLNPDFFHELADKKPVAKTDKRKLVYMLLDDSEENENFFQVIAKERELTFTRINGKKLVSKKGFFLFKSVNSWLSNIKHAELVITDSFHCTVFSILFKKKFICIANKHRGITRLENLLKLIHLEDRLIFNFNQLTENLLGADIDYQKVERFLSKEKNKSINFLKNSLEQVKAK